VPAWLDAADPRRAEHPHASTLEELADAVVRGATIVHARIPELRDLIEAVQARAEAVGVEPAKVHLAIGHAKKKAQRILLPKIEPRGRCVIGLCRCNDLDIAVTMSTGGATFQGVAGFHGATFERHARFREVRFALVAESAEPMGMKMSKDEGQIQPSGLSW